MSDSISLNSTNCGNSMIGQQYQKGTMESVELTGPWAQLWV